MRCLVLTQSCHLFFLLCFLFHSDHWSGLSFEQREELGFQVKRIFDIGRARYLEKLGFEVDLVYYVEKRTCLENLMILGVWKGDGEGGEAKLLESS